MIFNLKVLSNFVAEDILNFFIIFQRKSDDFHEISSLIFTEKKKKIKMSYTAVVISALRNKRELFCNCIKYD